MKIQNGFLVKIVFALIALSSGFLAQAAEDADGLYIPERRLVLNLPEDQKILSSQVSPQTEPQRSPQIQQPKETPSQAKAKSRAFRGRVISSLSTFFKWAKYLCNPEELFIDKAVAPFAATAIFRLGKKDVLREIRACLDLKAEIPQLKQLNYDGKKDVLFQKVIEKLSEIDDDSVRQFKLAVLKKLGTLTPENIDSKIKNIDPEIVFQCLISALDKRLYYLTGSKKYNPEQISGLPTLKSEMNAEVLEALQAFPFLPIARGLVAPIILNWKETGYSQHRSKKYDYLRIQDKLMPGGTIPKSEFATDSAITKYREKHGPIAKPHFDPSKKPKLRASKLLSTMHGDCNIIKAILYAYSQNPKSGWRTAAFCFSIFSGFVDLGYSACQIAQVCHNPSPQMLGIDKTMALLKIPDELRSAWYNGNKALSHKYVDNTKTSIALSAAMPASKAAASVLLSKYFKTPDKLKTEVAIDVLTESIPYELITKLQRSDFNFVKKHPFWITLAVASSEILSKGLVSPILKEIVKSGLSKFRKTDKSQDSDEQDLSLEEMGETEA